MLHLSFFPLQSLVTAATTSLPVCPVSPAVIVLPAFTTASQALVSAHEEVAREVQIGSVIAAYAGPSTYAIASGLTSRQEGRTTVCCPVKVAVSRATEERGLCLSAVGALSSD